MRNQCEATTATRYEQEFLSDLLGSNLGSECDSLLDDDWPMNVTLNDPVLIVDDVRNIFVERDGNKMTIQYGDLQIDDLFYMEDSNGRPRRYRVVDISGT